MPTEPKTSTTMDIGLIKELSNLGGLFIALIGAGWFVRYISDPQLDENGNLTNVTWPTEPGA